MDPSSCEQGFTGKVPKMSAEEHFKAQLLAHYHVIEGENHMSQTQVQVRKRNYLVGIPIFAKISIFVYLIYSCLPFSSNYEQLLFRNVDDLAMITSITKHQEAILQLDWQFIFFKYDYAYGWLFWITYAVFSFPAFILTKIFPHLQYFETFHILSNRMLSVLLIFVMIYLIKRIILLISNDDTYLNKLIAEILSFSILLYPSVGYWAGRVQPAALSSLLFVFCLFLFLKFRNEPSPKKYFGGRLSLSFMDFEVVAFGCLLGVKPTNIPMISLFLAIYFVLLFEQHIKLKDFLKLSFRYAAIGVIAIGVSAAPSILILPVKSVSKIIENIRFFSRNNVVGEIKVSQILLSIQKGFLVSGMGFISFFVLVSYGIFAVQRAKFQFQSSFKAVSVLAGSFLPILFFSITASDNLVLMSVYLFPLIVAQALLIPVMTLKVSPKRSFRSLILPLILLCSVGLNFLHNLASETNQKLAINTYLVDANSMSRHKQVLALDKLSELISDQRPLTIVQSYRSPNLVSELRIGVQTFYSFDNWGLFLDLDKIDYILVSQKDIALMNTQDQKFQMVQQVTRENEIRLGIDVVSRLFKENLFGDQKCKQIALEQGNTLFSCL